MYTAYIAGVSDSNLIKVGVSENLEKRMIQLHSYFGRCFSPLFSAPIPDTGWNIGKNYPATAVETLVRRKFPADRSGTVVSYNRREFYSNTLIVPIADCIREILSKNLHLRRRAGKVVIPREWV